VLRIPLAHTQTDGVIGAAGKVIHHWPKVAKAEAHPEEVLAA
jgi:peroxiredoxin